MSNSPHVIETTENQFEADVIERSRTVAVVLDFWATWCGPCRVLSPILEKLADEFAGDFVLVKADVDQMPTVAGEFGIRSIPTVLGIRDAKIVEMFSGALPEPAIREWLTRVLPSPAEKLLAAARAIRPKDLAAALKFLEEAHTLTPHDQIVQAELGLVLCDLGRIDEAKVLLEQIEKPGFIESEAERSHAELDLRVRSGAAGVVDVEALRADTQAHPDDLEARLKLAEALAAGGKREEALELCLDLVARDRKGLGEAARKVMLEIFQVLPDDSPLTTSYRRQLSALLFD